MEKTLYLTINLIDMFLAEKLMANTLQFNFCLPTPYICLYEELCVFRWSFYLFFIIELCLVEYEMLQYVPSRFQVSEVHYLSHSYNKTKAPHLCSPLCRLLHWT
ncbi:unnamed protein product [Brassica oleracea]